jgi:hypothetical protein
LLNFRDRTPKRTYRGAIESLKYPSSNIFIILCANNKINIKIIM